MNSYMVMCYTDGSPATPYHELIKGGLKQYTFSLEAAKQIAKDLRVQYSKYNDVYRVVEVRTLID